MMQPLSSFPPVIFFVLNDNQAAFLPDKGGIHFEGKRWMGDFEMRGLPSFC